MSWEAIEAAVLAGDAERVVELCVALREDERESMAEAAHDLHHYGDHGDERACRAASTAYFALGRPDTGHMAPAGHVERLVRSRPLAWRMTWLRYPHDYRGWAIRFQTLRALQRTGDCDALGPEEFAYLLVRALADGDVDGVRLFSEDPGLLADAVWAPFALERTWHSSIHAWDRAVLALAAEGLISRERLLDEWLGLIARTDDRTAAEHLIALHDRQLAPRPDEVEKRLDAYLLLLAGPMAPAAGMAAAALMRLDRVRPLDARIVLEPLAKAVTADTHAERAVALAARLHVRAPEAGALLAAALEHADPAAREAAAAAVDSIWDAIEQATEAGETERVAELCLALDEPQREAREQRALALWQRLSGDHAGNAVGVAAQTARFGLCPVPEDERVWINPPSTHLEALVRSRSRAWRDTWATWAGPHRLHRNRLAVWLTLRALLREDLCSAPDSGFLLLQALQRHEAPAELLRAHPETFEEDVFAPFRVAREDCWYATHDAWEAALLELAAEGAISRDRLLDETLAALLRQPGPQTAKGLVTFHERGLRPSPAELDARRDGYLRLLESDRDALVGFALATLLRLDRAHPLDGRALLDRIEHAVAIRAKTHAKRAVTLIGRVLDREPALDGTALLDALGHPSPEVQAEAVAVLERHPQLGVAAYLDVVDPSLRARLAGEAAAPPRVNAVGVPPPRLGPRPRLLEPIVPVEDLEELLELASALIEGLDDPDEGERFVDGLSRLCDLPVPASRRDALLRRAEKNHVLCASLCEHWLRREGHASFGWNGPTTAIAGRLVALAGRLHTGMPGVLLSAPTHRGGFLDPDVLRDRLERTITVDDHDLAQALLRVPDAAGFIAREDQPVTRDTLEVLAAPGELRAERARDKHGPGPYHGVPALSPARLLAETEGLWEMRAGDNRQMQRWLSFVWPTGRELYFAGVARTLRVAEEHDWIDRKRRLEPALQTLLYPNEPLGPEALRLLALSLFDGAATRLLGTDVVIDAIATRRLPPEHFAEALLGALQWPARKPARLAAALEPVATAGPLHAHELQRLLEALLARLGQRSAQWIGVIDLLRRLAQEADARIEEAGARAYLESLSAKSGRLAKATLAVSGDGAARSIEAARYATQGPNS